MNINIKRGEKEVNADNEKRGEIVYEVKKRQHNVFIKIENVNNQY